MGLRLCHDGPVDSTITIISTRADDPDSFERMSLDERREASGGWQVFPVRSGRALDTFLMAATDSDFAVFASGIELVDDEGASVRTNMITRGDVKRVIPNLEELVEKHPDRTARALVAHDGNRADLARVLAALGSDGWPEGGDPAEEAAAFAHHLLKQARVAKGDVDGVCWEYRGTIVV
ncbi:MAG: hypothetical protein H0T46_22820 [Deltaproteobacteria bacterium]|nr:hypothetical protein [Deltaproteobacteria bacterium]